ncbi:MAG: hypothetical protein KJ893_10365 [Candidatus Omnitrophica bacterium]|nr:hypothetical protein [Candidatus Omnitrophota bacterium]MBU4478909.1 hypothetical protein [Candidatus Omnitrophota bacterium]MCG2704370.1 hypothetical protein [Candidatus Omnitrophota bacterium]
MIDKNLEAKIKLLNDFVVLWASFYELYKRATNQATFTEEEEKNFLELKSSLARKYQGLMDALGIKPTAEDRTFDVISQVMSLKSILMLSPLQMEKIENDWHSSYITLNKIMGSLENRKNELAKISAFNTFCRRVFANPFVALIFIILFISVIFYLVKNFFS